MEDTVSRILRLLAVLVLAIPGMASSQTDSAERMVPGVSLQETAASLARSGAARNDARRCLVRLSC